MTNWQTYALGSFIITFLVLLVSLNLWHYHYRQSLTQAERDEDDFNPER